MRTTMDFPYRDWDACERRQRQGFLGRRQFIPVKEFAVCRFAAVKILAVPGSDAGFRHSCKFFARIIGSL